MRLYKRRIYDTNEDDLKWRKMRLFTLEMFLEDDLSGNIKPWEIPKSASINGWMDGNPGIWKGFYEKQ